MSKWVSGSTLGLVVVAYAFTAWFLDFEPLARRPWLMFGFVFLLDLVIVALVFADENISPAQSVSGFAVFGLLALWTSKSLSNELLNAALAFYFILPCSIQVFRRYSSAGEAEPHNMGPSTFSRFSRSRLCWCRFSNLRKFPSSSGRSFCWRICSPLRSRCSRPLCCPFWGVIADARRHRRAPL